MSGRRRRKTLLCLSQVGDDTWNDGRQNNGSTFGHCHSGRISLSVLSFSLKSVRFIFNAIFSVTNTSWNRFGIGFCLSCRVFLKINLVNICSAFVELICYVRVVGCLPVLNLLPRLLHPL